MRRIRGPHPESSPAGYAFGDHARVCAPGELLLAAAPRPPAVAVIGIGRGGCDWSRSTPDPSRFDSATRRDHLSTPSHRDGVGHRGSVVDYPSCRPNSSRLSSRGS